MYTSETKFKVITPNEWANNSEQITSNLTVEGEKEREREREQEEEE